MKTKISFVFMLVGLINGLAQDCANSIRGQDDTLTYNTNGVLVAINGVATTASSYNVLSNDHIFDCVNNTNSTATTSNVVFTPQTFPTGSAFTILSSGIIHWQNSVNAGSTYTYTYTIQALINTAIVEQHTVTINIVAPSPFAPTAPPTTASSKTGSIATTNSQACPTCIDFPDVNLKARLLTQGCCLDYPLNTTDIVDTNGDGEIEYDEAAHIGLISIPQANVTNLSGLEWFINLKRLNIAANPITTINTAMLSNGLDSFQCSYTLISTINISNFPNLINFICNNTNISALDAGSNPNLQNLNIANTPITNLNIKNTSSLNYTNSYMSASCWTNCPNLTSICADASEIPALQSFLSTCGVSTASIDINSSCGLAVENHSIKEGITITPNPSSGVFVVAFANGISDKTELVVYNVLGQKMLAATVSSGSGQWQLDLSGYPSGAYLVKITSGSGVVEKTIIKN